MKTNLNKRKRRRLVAPAPVMVDELIVYPNAWGPFLRGSCHLTCRNIEKLHRFAQSIGLKREWFQNHHKRPELWHYDLTAGKRKQALAAGAIFVPIMTQARADVKRWRNSDREKNHGND